MNFTEPCFHLRMRSHWEAADLGILIWRRKAGVLMLFVLAPLLLLNVPLALFFSTLPVPPFFDKQKDYIFLLCIAAHIWLKPLYDRFALKVCSTVFFEKDARVKTIFRGLGDILLRGLAGDLLWRRFSPYRGVRLPLRVLERPSASQYAVRKEKLARGGINFGAFLTIFCIILEYALNLGSIVFLFAVKQLSGGFPENITELVLTGISPALLRLFNFALVETLYIAMGFAVYINSRVTTEGWDLQLAFKKMAEEKTARAGTR